MLLQYANIVDNACKIIQNWPGAVNKPHRLAALKCIEAVVNAGVGLPIQHIMVLSSQIKSECEECAFIAVRILAAERKSLSTLKDGLDG